MQPKCSPGTSSMSITWELARNAESQTPPRSAESESTFSPNPQVIHMHIKVWEDWSITYLEATVFHGSVEIFVNSGVFWLVAEKSGSQWDQSNSSCLKSLTESPLFGNVGALNSPDTSSRYWELNIKPPLMETWTPDQGLCQGLRRFPSNN